MAAPIRVLSAGAVEPGLVAAAQAFSASAKLPVDLAWATTPTIKSRVDAGERFDLLVVPEQALAELSRMGKIVSEEGVALGRVGVGVAVRSGVALPDIASEDAFKQSLFGAESVIFTRATSGIYVESMLRHEGIYDRLLPRITRFFTGPEMMAHLIHGTLREICLGPIVELLMFRNQGASYVGSLPARLQHFTAYCAVPMSAPAEELRLFLRYLASPPAKAEFAACGMNVD